MALSRKHEEGDPSFESTTPVQRPESVPAMATDATPVRILDVDVDQPLPVLRADDHYSTAYVLFWRSGFCLGDAIIDLTEEPASIERRLRTEVDRLKQTDVTSHPTASVPDSDMPFISVVVPTIVQRLEALQRCIDSIEQLDYPNYELILVDNRRSIPEFDPLPEMIRGRLRSRAIREERPGISAARNEGISNANGDIIAFTDDDVRVDKGWLRAIGTRLAQMPNLDAVTGLILPEELESPAQIWFERYFGGFNGKRSFIPVTLESDQGKTRLLRGSRILAHDPTGTQLNSLPIYGVGAYAAGANMTFRKSALTRIGGFDVALGTGTPSHGGEDLAAIIDILWTGGTVGYEPAAVVHHQHRREYAELLTLMDGEGTGLTAMLTSLARKDTRHVLGLATQFAVSIRKTVGDRLRKAHGRSEETPIDVRKASFPPSMVKTELRGCLKGPRAYYRSRAEWKRNWS